MDDEIRDLIKEVKSLLIDPERNRGTILQKTKEIISQVAEMIFKEENILFQMALDTLRTSCP